MLTALDALGSLFNIDWLSNEQFDNDLTKFVQTKEWDGNYRYQSLTLFISYPLFWIRPNST